MDARPWSPLEDALNWRAFWSEGKEMRQSANKKSPCQRAMVEDWASVLIHYQGKCHLLVHAPTGRNACDTADLDLLPEGVPSWREVKAHLSDHAPRAHPTPAPAPR